MSLTEKQELELLQAAEPLMKWLAQHPEFKCRVKIEAPVVEVTHKSKLFELGPLCLSKRVTKAYTRRSYAL